MYRVLACVATEHDLRLVVLAALICAVAAFTSFRIYGRAVNARATQDPHQYHRLAWLGLAGLSTGAGIWSTHFVAMLAYDSGFPTAYDPTLTLASLVFAIGVTTIGYLISVEHGKAARTPYRYSGHCRSPVRDLSRGYKGSCWWRRGGRGHRPDALHGDGGGDRPRHDRVEQASRRCIRDARHRACLCRHGRQPSPGAPQGPVGRTRPADACHLLPALHGNGGSHHRARSDHHRASLRHEYRGHGIRGGQRHDAGDAGRGRCRAGQCAGRARG